MLHMVGFATILNHFLSDGFLPLTSLAIRGSDLSMVLGWCKCPRVPSGSLVLFFLGFIFVVFAAVL